MAANSILHQAKLLEALWLLKKSIIDSESVDVSVLKRKEMLDLESFIMTERLSEQQLRDASADLERARLYVNILACIKDLNQKQVGLIERISVRRVSRDLQGYVNDIETGKRFGTRKLDDMVRYLKTIQERYSLNGISEQERLMIVKAIGLGKGHWYKCQNGHYYATGDCGGATQRGKSPECGSVIGGEGHRLAAGNLHASEFDGSSHAAYSEEANNLFNLDPDDLRRLQLH